MTVKLVGVRSNRNAIGARVRAVAAGGASSGRKCAAGAAICRRTISASISASVRRHVSIASKFAGPADGSRAGPTWRSISSTRSKREGAMRRNSGRIVCCVLLCVERRWNGSSRRAGAGNPGDTTTILAEARQLIDAGQPGAAVEKLRAAPARRPTRHRAARGRLLSRQRRRPRDRDPGAGARANSRRIRPSAAKPCRSSGLSHYLAGHIAAGDSVPRSDAGGRARRHQAGLRPGHGVRADASAGQGPRINRAHLPRRAGFGGLAPAHRAD